ncbi:Beta-xylosidase, GH43 family [Parapedobacter composti]|uniref:Beta-xylosidase, GH43 family n=1 Tax=Parapedobacter composti TaxID=623281 RepID=A0A1I1F093_9SPHI|nr:glycoside hydrolase family 43 protein [Parapedobacter composti]SFB90590.1 Beta-xylosidase, GH43 family [Parapedobacter composti]
MKLEKAHFRILMGICIVLILACKTEGPSEAMPPPSEEETPIDDNTFTNPLLPRGADPWITQKDGTYYYTYTHGSRLVLYVIKKVSELANATPINIFVPPPGETYSQNIWAPELHEIDGKWYMYFAADGNGTSHRMYVIENKSGSPLRGAWELKGRVADPTDEWAIDGTVMKYNDQLYMLWSGGTGGNQKIFIAKMSNPWTIEGERVQISTPIYSWEKQRAPSGINEGPQPLFNPQGELFVIFSASLFSSDHYCLGWLRLKNGGDPMDPSHWTKHPQPVFSMRAENGAYGPGHNGFFKSPDGTEDWIIYHARNLPDGGSTNYRNPRIQKFTWNPDGTPNFGVPVKIGERIKKPSGE